MRVLKNGETGDTKLAARNITREADVHRAGKTKSDSFPKIRICTKHKYRKLCKVNENSV